MSGFAGYILNDQKQTINRQLLNDMKEGIKHRGPFEEDYYTDDFFRIGYRSLYRNESMNDDQPLLYENNRYWIFIAGVIYNAKDLRTQLENSGHVFKTQTVAEVVLRHYIKFGKSMLNRLRGMFSLLIWDKQTTELFGARDPFGIKPFYLLDANDRLYFASEMKS